MEFAGKALVQIVLSAINAVGGFREGVLVYLYQSINQSEFFQIGLTNRATSEPL